MRLLHALLDTVVMTSRVDVRIDVYLGFVSAASV